MTKHCRECGTEMKIVVVPNETTMKSLYERNRKFDEYTGERLYAKRFKCPNDRWYSVHDNDFHSDNLNKFEL